MALVMRMSVENGLRSLKSVLYELVTVLKLVHVPLIDRGALDDTVIEDNVIIR